jgi:pyruvate formate lyase activating enzyme
MKQGVLFSIEEFAVNDGPGIRTTVFLKGCPLRCAWCHNPEGQRHEPQPLTKQGRTEMCGYEIDAETLAEKLRRDEEIFRDSGGGVTFTGGEPLAQVDFLCEVLDRLGDIHTAVETSGYASAEAFERVLERVDFVLFDIKLADSSLHKRWTGVGNELILANLKTLCASGKPFVARVPLIPGVNDSAANMEATAELLVGAKGLERVELLRYHKTAGAKYPMVGLDYAPDFDEDAAPEIHDKFTDKGIKLLIL